MKGKEGGKMRGKGWEERGPKKRSKNSEGERVGGKGPEKALEKL